MTRPQRAGIAAAVVTIGIVVAAVAMRGMGPGVGAGDRAVLGSDRIGEEVVLGTTVASTERADEALGAPSEVRALEPLPALVDRMPEPGTAARPALFVRLSVPRARGEVVDAYAAMWERYGGSGGYDVVVRAPGWPHVLDREGPAEIEELACTSQLRELVSLGYEPDDVARDLDAGCRDLARRLGAPVSGTIDWEALLPRLRRMVDRDDELGGDVTLRIVREGGLPVGALHRVARGLGFTRADFGAYAWWNEQPVGHDQLIHLYAEREDPLQIGFGGLEEGDRIDAAALVVRLDEVPLPRVVADRAAHAAETIAHALDARIDLEGEPYDRARWDAHVAETIAALEREGLLAPVAAE